ncbi:hypothetical protein PanWU01x14_336050 [Parasponia andersonii]|uniref:Proton pump-interactor n=1 Tax=Parasponia andersonii TaxID=3476 RepID=A0A2P5AG52_PARAD|nr:hypothetical protein PanWU01x14_336050 [Parasponia andersonii]
MTGGVCESEVVVNGPEEGLANSANGNADADFDGSYVFVTDTDASDKDVVDSDLHAPPQPEQPLHNAEAEAEAEENIHETKNEAAEINVESSQPNGEAEGGEEIHQTQVSTIKSDQPDENQHQESDIAVNALQTATTQDKEQAELFNVSPLGGTPGTPPPDGLEQDPVVTDILPISIERCDVLPHAVPEHDDGALDPAEQCGPSENAPSLPSPPEIGPTSSPTLVDSEQPLSFSEGDDGVDVEPTLEAPPCSQVDKSVEIQVSNGPLSEENGDGLPVGSISETVVITDLVGAGQDTPERKNQTCENAESFPVSNKITEDSDVKNEVSLPAGDLPTCDFEDVRPETDTDTGKANQKDIENPESCPVENENMLVNPESIGLASDGRSQPETCSASSGVEEKSSADAIDVESEDSNRTPECDGSQSMSCAQTNVESVSDDNTLVDHDCSLPASLVAADSKLESEVENTTAVRGRDILGDDVIASEGENSGSVVDGNIDSENVGSDVKSTSPEAASINRNQKDQTSTSLPEDSSEGQKEVFKRPFYYLIRIPKCDDENLKEQIKLAQLRVEERTKSRDAIRAQIQMKRATLNEYGDKIQASLTEERAAKDSLKSKRQEVDSAQSVINKVKNAKLVEEIDGRIRHMEHMIEHETVPLKEEKQLIREIKQLKQHREQLLSSMGNLDEIQQALDQKDQNEERLKVLRKELDLLRSNLTKAEEATQTAKNRYNDENEKLNDIVSQFRTADGIRQEAYAHLQSLRKEQYEKNKHFWRYKDDAKAAQNLKLSGDKEQLQSLCLDQVERVMEVWNRNDDFRRQYIQCNTRSTLWRLRTLDGRSLGPDEDPPVIPGIVNNRMTKSNPVRPISVPEEVKQDVPVKAEKSEDKSVAKVVERKDQTAKTRSSKPVSGNSPAITSSEDEIKEREEEARRTKEEEELARKAEELRKEEEAAKLKQQRKLEEKVKAKEAIDRKKRIAEKARARAAIRAQKEAEEKEKERERRAKKKERKKANGTDVTNQDGGESAPTPSLEIPATASGVPTESETKEKATTTVKRPQKGSQFIKQSRTKSMPLPLRNRGKRRMQPWMWIALVVVFVLALFLVGKQWLLL